MPDVSDLYERDFVRWSEEQASALRAAALSGTNLPLDWENIAEEIDSLGKSLKSELRNRMATIIEHLLKLQVSPGTDPRAGWIETVRRERLSIEELISENPSLRATLADSMSSADGKARKLLEIGLDRYGEWSPTMRRAVSAIHMSENQVLGPWLPQSKTGHEQ